MYIFGILKTRTPEIQYGLFMCTQNMCSQRIWAPSQLPNPVLKEGLQYLPYLGDMKSPEKFS